MATKHFCDICGKEIPAGENAELQIYHPIPVYGTDETDMDICMECHRRLINYIEARKNKWIVNIIHPDTYR